MKAFSAVQDVIVKIENIEDVINSIDMSDIGGVTESMSTEFSIALQNAVDVKMKGPKFDEFESTVRSKVSKIQFK